MITKLNQRQSTRGLTSSIDDLFARKMIDALNDTDPEKKFLQKIHNIISENWYCDRCDIQYKKNEALKRLLGERKICLLCEYQLRGLGIPN